MPVPGAHVKSPGWARDWRDKMQVSERGGWILKSAGTWSVTRVRPLLPVLGLRRTGISPALVFSTIVSLDAWVGWEKR